jgi:malonate-semialdehyde dehydrogenase (acetylating)/methylmalonate-semialdehyde dehydrogenase
VDADSQRKLDVISPVDGNHLSTVSMSMAKDLDDAVISAKAAFAILETDSPLKKEYRFSFVINTY